MTDHYANFDCLLIRLPLADPEAVRSLFAQAWRAYAPKKLVAQYQADPSSWAAHSSVHHLDD